MPHEMFSTSIFLNTGRKKERDCFEQCFEEYSPVCTVNTSFFLRFYNLSLNVVLICIFACRKELTGANDELKHFTNNHLYL